MLSIRCFPMVPFLILIAFIMGAMFPWREVLGGSYYDHQRLLQSMILMVLAMVWVARNWRQDLLSACRDRYLRLGFWAMMVGGAASVWLGLVPANGLVNYLHWLLLFSLFVVCTQARVQDAFFTAGGMLVAQAAAVFLGMVYLVFALIRGDSFSPNIIYPGVDNIRFFNQIQVFVVALLIFLLGHPRIGGWAFGLLTANLLLMALGGARGTIFVALMTMFLVGLVLPQQRPRIYRAVAALLVAGVFYFGLRSLESQGIYPLVRPESSSVRLSMWMEIMDFLQFHNILWGVGPGNYNQFEVIHSHPHNSVLQVLIEWGVTALTGAALIIGRLLILAYRHIRRYPEDELTQALLAALVAGLGYSLISGVIVMPVPQTLLFMFAGLVWGRAALVEKSAAPQQTDLGRQRSESLISIRGWQSVLAATLVLVLTVPYMWFVSNYFLQATSREGPSDGPGFWRNGAAFMMPER